MQSIVDKDSQLLSQVESDSEFLGMLAGSLLPSAVSGISKLLGGSKGKKGKKGDKGDKGEKGEKGGKKSESKGIKQGLMIA